MLNIISQSIYQLNPSGPRKVVRNLIKGLREAGVDYVINKNPLDCKYNWIHDDPQAIAYLLKKFESGIPHQDRIESSGTRKNIFGPNIFFSPANIESLTKPGFDMTNLEKSPLAHGSYIMPSTWVSDFWKKHGYTAPTAIWPVGVDTEFFTPQTDAAPQIASLEKVLVYTKGRSQSDILAITDFLDEQKISYSLFSYGSYSEKDLMEEAQYARFGIIIGSSESQGLAIEELMSLNLPLAVFDITYLNQASCADKSGKDGSKDLATTIPYFDERCGLVAKDVEGMKKIILEMDEYENPRTEFKPREFILQNLTLEKQTIEFLKIMNYPIDAWAKENPTDRSLDNSSGEQSDHSTAEKIAPAFGKRQKIRNWRNRTWYYPVLKAKFILKYLRWKF